MLKTTAIGLARKRDTHVLCLLQVYGIFFRHFFNMRFKTTSPVSMRCPKHHTVFSCDKDWAFPLRKKLWERGGGGALLQSALLTLTVQDKVRKYERKQEVARYSRGWAAFGVPFSFMLNQLATSFLQLRRLQLCDQSWQSRCKNS